MLKWHQEMEKTRIAIREASTVNDYEGTNKLKIDGVIGSVQF
jgi:hypothetical protein